MKIEVYDCCQKFPGKWKELTVENDDELIDIIYCQLQDEEWVYDCDFCGDQKFSFVIRENDKKRYLDFYHEFYVSNEGDELEVKDEFYYEWSDKIEKPYPEKNRDWIKVYPGVELWVYSLDN